MDKIEDVFVVGERKNVMDTVAVMYRPESDEGRRRHTSYFYCASEESAQRLKAWLSTLVSA